MSGCLWLDVFESKCTRLPLQTYEHHPVEWVGRVKELRRVERHEQAVGAELDVLRHEVRVHADEGNGQRVAHELLLVLHRLAHDGVQLGVGELLLQLGVEQAG